MIQTDYLIQAHGHTSAINGVGTANGAAKWVSHLLLVIYHGICRNSFSLSIHTKQEGILLGNTE